MSRPRINAVHVIAPLALLVTLSGTAVAATGDALLLGQGNTESATTTLVNHNGTALRLAGHGADPPLKVGTDTTRVPSLNASLLGGLSLAVLQQHRLVFDTAGSSTFTVPKGFHHMTVTVVGAGGGGGAGLTNGPAGSGGGSGGQVTVWAPVTPGSSWTVDVGAGGIAGTTGTTTTAPAAGAASSVRDSDGTLATGNGGGAGVNGTACGSGATTVSLGGGKPGAGTGPAAPLLEAGAVGLQGVNGVAGGSSVTTCPDTTTAGDGGNTNLAGGGGFGGIEAGSVREPLNGRPGAVIVEFLR